MEVFAEADRTELISVIQDITKIDKKDIESVLKAYPEAISMLLKFSKPMNDGSKRVEINGIGIYRLKQQPASVGKGLAAGVEIPAHLTLKVKAHRGMLDAVTNHFDMEAKNR